MGPIEQSINKDIQENQPLRVQPAGKWKTVKDYRGGSLIDKVRKCESLQELEELRNTVIVLRRQRRLSAGTVRKLDKVGAERYRYLSTRLIITPPSTRVITGPSGIVSPGGIILP